MPESAKQELLRIAQRALTIVSDPARLGSDGELREEQLDEVYTLLGRIFMFGPEDAFRSGRDGLLWALGFHPNMDPRLARLDVHPAAVGNLRAALQVLIDDVSTTTAALTKRAQLSDSSGTPQSDARTKQECGKLAAKALQFLEDRTLPVQGGEILPTEYHGTLTSELSALVIAGVGLEYTEVHGVLAALGWRPRKSWLLMAVAARGATGVEPSLRSRVERTATDLVMVAQVKKVLGVMARLAPEGEAPKEVPEQEKLRAIGKRQLKLGFMSASQLAEEFGLLHKREALRKRLEKWRTRHLLSGEWTTMSEPGSRKPKFLYEIKAVQHILDDMTTKYRTSSERPAN
jgi:hypothetical protein